MAFACGMCEEETCAGCPVAQEEEDELYVRLHADEYVENQESNFKKELEKRYKAGHDAGYLEGYKKTCEVCKRERTSPMYIYVEPDGTWCAIYDTACDGYDLNCKMAETREEN